MSVRKDKVAENFIKRYGMKRFQELITMIGSGQSGQVIADHFNVSRERVRQWKNCFSEVITHYRLFPEIDRILRNG